MADVARLRIAVDSDGVRVSRSELDKLGRSGRRAEREVKTATGSMRSEFSRLSGAATALTGAFAALGGAMVARELIRSINLYQQLESQLKLVTTGTENLASTQDELFKVAQRTYTSYEGTVQLYARLARNADQLGASQQDLYKFTTATNQAMQISGASAQESASGILQLSQALASGELRGEELRSVMENTPRLAQAIAQGLAELDSSFDGSIGGLRDLAEQGELTAKRVLAALLNQSDEIEDEFQDMGRRVDQAMIQLQNDVQRVFEDTDTQPLIDAIDDLRDAVNDEDFKQGLQFIAKSFVNATAEVTELIGEVNKFKDALSEPFELSSALKFIWNRTGPGFAYNNFIKDNGPNGASGSWQGGATGSFEMDPIDVESDTLQLSGSGGLFNPPKGGGSKRESEIQRRLASLREEVALYGDLSRAEETRIALANGFYGQVSQQQAAQLMRYAEELDAKDNLATQQERMFERFEAGNQRDADLRDQQIEQVQRLTEELMTQEERATAALNSRLELINRNVTDEAQAAELRSRVWQRYVDEYEQGTDRMSAFAEQAARNIQDELGDTLRDTLSGDFDGIFDSWRNMLLDMVAEAQAAQLAKALFGDYGADGGKGKLGGLVGTIGSAIGGMFGGGGVSATSASTSFADAGIGSMTAGGGGSSFGGFFANGGNPPIGKASIVGENGPEMIVPRTPTTVIPNHAIAANSGVVNNIRIINETGGQVEQQRQTNSTGGVDFVAIIRREATSAINQDVARGGPVSKSMAQRWNLQDVGKR